MRSSPETFSILTPDCHLEIDFAARTVRANGTAVSLTPTEYDVLVCLAARTSAVVPLDDLIEAVWGDWFGPRGHVSVHVHHLRRKLGRCGALIVTRRGVGYMLQSGSDGAAHPLPAGWGLSSLFDVLTVDGDARSVIWLLVNADRTIAWISESLTPLTDWRSENLVGHFPWEFLDESGHEVRLLIDRGAAGTIRPPFPVHLRCPDGTTTEVSVTVRVFRDPEGSYLGALTEWQPLEQCASLRSVTLHFDEHSTLLAVEPHELFLGWDPQQIIGSYFSLAGLDQASTLAALSGWMAAGIIEQEITVPAKGADGTTTPVTAVLRLDVQDGRFAGYSGEIRLGQD